MLEMEWEIMEIEPRKTVTQTLRTVGALTHPSRPSGPFAALFPRTVPTCWALTHWAFTGQLL